MELFIVVLSFKVGQSTKPGVCFLKSN